MPRSVGLAHILRPEDGPVSGIWGVFLLRSAFQPIFAFEQGRLSMTAFEGLIRPTKNGAAVAPASFFASIPPEDRLHVETLSRTVHLLNAGRYLDRAASIFVNFDPSLFSEPVVTETALRDMRLVLREAEIDPARIVCELTEQKAKSPAALAGFAAALRAQGFRIAVDDYGAEESDIHRIQDLQPDIVKFDAHWIVRLMDSAPGGALLKAMVQTFENRGIRTLFEGIEEMWQLELAESFGVSMVQGFALARPEPAPTSFAVFNPHPSEPPPRPADPIVAPSREPAVFRPVPPTLTRSSTFGKRGLKR